MVFATGEDAEKLKKDYVTEEEDKDSITLSWGTAIILGFATIGAWLGGVKIGQYLGRKAVRA